MEKVENERPKKGPKTKKVKLTEPIEWGDEGYIKEINLSAPRGKHLMLMPNNPTTKDLLILASKVSDVPFAAFQEMSAKDVLAVVEAVGELL